MKAYVDHVHCGYTVMNANLTYFFPLVMFPILFKVVAFNQLANAHSVVF